MPNVQLHGHVQTCSSPAVAGPEVLSGEEGAFGSNPAPRHLSAALPEM